MTYCFRNEVLRKGCGCGSLLVFVAATEMTSSTSAPYRSIHYRKKCVLSETPHCHWFIRGGYCIFLTANDKGCFSGLVLPITRRRSCQRSFSSRETGFDSSSLN